MKVLRVLPLVLSSLLAFPTFSLAQDVPQTADGLAALGVGALADQSSHGDAGAALILGRILSDKTRTDAEHQQAVAALEQASAAGITEAQVRLGDIYRNGLSGVAPDPAKAVGQYESAVAAGDGNAQFQLGRMLLAGQGTAKDPARAVTLLEAASKTNIDARVALAGLYARGEGVTASSAKAIELYDAGLAVQNRSAINGLAQLYRRGAPDMQPSPEQALAYYRIVADLGDNGAAKSIADMMIRGEGAPADVTGGIARLEAIAEADPSAFVTLGDYFSIGQAVPRDVEHAIRYFELGAGRNVINAMTRLGDIYRNGAGAVEPNPAKAYAYFSDAAKAGDAGALRKAAEMQARGEGIVADLAAATSTLEQVGDANALILLGDLYSKGEATRRDLPKATAYYDAAAKLGNGAGYAKLGDLYRSGAPDIKPSGKKAAAYYTQAIALGDNGARRNLAAILLEGRLVAADPKRAVSLLQAALDAGDAQAGINLGNAYASGNGVTADYKKAVAAFDGAVAKGNASAAWRKNVAILAGPLADKHRKSALADLQAAVADKTPGAGLELARLQVSGKLGGGGPAAGIKTLKSMDPDSASVRYLAQLYRDGIKDQLKPNFRAATQLLEESAALLGPDSLRFERVLLGAAKADAAGFPAMAEDFKALTRVSGSSALQRLRSINQNAYVYLVQRWMAETKRYGGPSDGLLSVATIKAFNQLCAEAGAKDQCAKGPLSGEAADLVANFIYAARPTT